MSKLLSIQKQLYIELLKNQTKPIVICTGPTGSGKTFLACESAITQLLSGNYKKILITRPAVSIHNEQHGFLPGTLEKKMDPWIKPVLDNMESITGPKKIADLFKYKIIEVCPFGYIRGRTFKDTYIIADEMQNSTQTQFQTLLTRIGDSSKIVVNGDLAQSDDPEANGLNDFIHRLCSLQDLKYVEHIDLSTKDIIRHPAVNEILDIYLKSEIISI